MGIAERIALAPSCSDLSWADDKHKTIEFVAALSATTNLGSDLHRAKDYDLHASRRAILLLAKKAITHGRRNKCFLSQAQAQAMACAVIVELCMPRCRTCHGAGVTVIDKLKVVCETCGGATMHRYSDRERAGLCGIKPSEWLKWERRYLMVMSIARGHDTAQYDAAKKWG